VSSNDGVVDDEEEEVGVVAVVVAVDGNGGMAESPACITASLFASDEVRGGGDVEVVAPPGKAVFGDEPSTDNDDAAFDVTVEVALVGTALEVVAGTESVGVRDEARWCR